MALRQLKNNIEEKYDRIYKKNNRMAEKTIWYETAGGYLYGNI